MLCVCVCESILSRPTAFVFEDTLWLFAVLYLSFSYVLLFFKTLTPLSLSLGLSFFFCLSLFSLFIILLRRKIYQHVMCQIEDDIYSNDQSYVCAWALIIDRPRLA